MNPVTGNELLRGEKIRLRPFSKESQKGYEDWVQYDIELLRLMNDDLVFPEAPHEQDQWFEHALHDTNQYNFDICTLADDRMIGNINFHGANLQTRSSEIGVFVGDPAFRGGGYGTDAMRVLLRFGFLELGLHRAALEVFSFNPRAIKSYEKVGFKHEGAIRAGLMRDGVAYDLIIMSILSHEWRAINDQ